MILNYPSKSQKYNQTQIHRSMKSNTYPKQDSRYVNLLVALSFRDEKDEETRWRLKLSSKTHNYTYDTEAIFLCLRCDAEYPYKAIFINSRGDVIVSDSDKITNLLTPSRFRGMQRRYQEISTMFKRNYADLQYDDEYNSYTDFVHLIPAQDKEFLGLEGFTEYENDLVKKEDIPNREDQAIKQEDPNYHSVERRFRDVARVYPTLGYTNKNHPESLTSFPMMHYIHDKNYIDKPFATRNPAVIIRTDRNRDDVVFMERAKSPDDDSMVLRFLTGNEVFFYYESEDQFIVEREEIEPPYEDTENFDFGVITPDDLLEPFDFLDEDMIIEASDDYDLELGDEDTDRFTPNEVFNFGDDETEDGPSIPGYEDDPDPVYEERIFDYGLELYDGIDDTSTPGISDYSDFKDEDQYYLDLEKPAEREPKVLARYRYEFKMEHILEEIINGRIQV